MKSPKGIKPKKEWHASSAKVGMGDFYGTGVKQKVGRIREDYMTNEVPSKKMGKPPKSLA